MNTLTPNRILQKGDEYRDNGSWKPVPKEEIGLQVMFSKLKKHELRRPSEAPPKKTFPAAPVLAEPKMGLLGAAHCQSSGEARDSTGAADESRTQYETSRGGREPISPKVEGVMNDQPPKAENGNAPAPTRSGAGETPAIRIPLKHIKLPTVVSRRAHMVAEVAAEIEDEMRRKIKGYSPIAKLLPPTNATIPFTCTKHVGKGRPSPQSDPIWTGRNGMFKGYAVELSKVGDNLCIFPVGKRGIGHCEIQIPVCDIPKLIEELQEMFPSK